MLKDDLILNLYKSQATVFKLKELVLMFPDTSYQNLKSSLYYYTKVGKLKKLRSGIYAKNEYDPLELAGKTYSPSYISLETVLHKSGIIFQYYDTIFAISNISRKITADKHKIFYRKIKDEILLNNSGITNTAVYAIATKERAFLDAIFLYKDYHFDNLTPLDWNLVNKIKHIYESKALLKRVDEYYKIYIETNA